MREKIESMAKGIFKYDTPSILLLEDEIVKGVVAGTSYTGSFTIKNTKQTKMKGLLYSSSKLLTLHTDKFTECENVITYEFDAMNLNIGEVIKGFITVVSDCGEIQIPFQIHVEAPYFDSSIGKIKDLTHFTNLAKIDPLEALRLFKSPEFERIILQYESKYKIIYKELVKSKVPSGGMEEFLIAVHKKLPVTITTDKNKVSYDLEKESIKDKIVLTKDNWGYGEYKITTDAPFITLEHKIIWADNFINNNYALEYILHPENMRVGNNFGIITIKGAHQTILIEVTCRYNKSRDNSVRDNKNKNYSHRKERPYLIKLAKNYINFRKDKITVSEYVEEGFTVLSNLIEGNKEKKILYQLMKIHYLMVSSKEEEAKLELQKISEHMNHIKDNEFNENIHDDIIIAYCGYEYLMALIHKDDESIQRASDIIRSFYGRGHDNYELLWILLHLDKKYDKNKNLRLTDIKTQYEKGCRSPFLYFEAATIYNLNPALLLELGKFELNVLLWSIKEDYISKEASIQFAYLASKLKAFNPLVMKGLEIVYEKYKEMDTLFTICSLLIRGHKRSEKYFHWFNLGVNSQLRITELYEYFMYSYDDSKEIIEGELTLPGPVLLYFIYNSNLSERKKAFLYAYIIINKENLPSVYKTYSSKIGAFAKRQMMAQNISYHLSIIYQDYLSNNEITEEIELALPNVMFRYQIECNNPEMKGVYVVFQEVKEANYSPFVNGVAQINIYAESGEIFLVDNNDNRYVSSALYTVHKLMPWEEYIHLYYKSRSLSPMLLVNLSTKAKHNYNQDIDKIYIKKELSKLSILSNEYERRNTIYLVNYFYNNFDGESLDYYLDLADLEGLTSRERYDIIELFIIRGMFDRAVSALDQYGYEGIAINRLMKLCNNLIADDDSSDDKSSDKGLILNLAYYIFKAGKYNEDILNYLIDRYNGSTRDMFVLWESAVAFELKTTSIEERLLGQMLFTESCMINSVSVFLKYYRHGANHNLIKAFLSYHAYKYLINGRIINNELFHIMKKEAAYEDNELCVLALIKYYTTQEFLTESELQLIDYNIHRFVSKGIVLPFFLHYKHQIVLPTKLCDKYYIEYFTNPKNKVVIHYRFDDKEGEDDFIEEDMLDMYMGIHVKELVLFKDEKIEYYISQEDEDGQVNITERFTASQEDESSLDMDTRYNHINLMISALDMEDDKTLMESLLVYMKNKYIIDEVFKPL